MNNKNLIVFALTLLSLALAVVELMLNSGGESVSMATEVLWSLIFIMLTILWAEVDSRLTHFEKPFDFDFLMYIFWPVAFPYYLIATRGAKGGLVFAGFVALWCGPLVLGLGAHS